MPSPAQPQNPPPATSIPTPQPSTPVAVQGLDGLAVQLRALEAQLLGLQAQARDLRTQIRRGAGDRTDLSGQLAEVNSQIARVNSQIAAVRGDIGARVGIPTAPIIPSIPRRGIDGDDVTAIFIVFMLAVLMPISLGITRRLWRRGNRSDAPRADETIAPRLDRLEQAVDAVAIEIERISESQRFVTRILAERPRPAANAAAAPANQEPVAERPVLALGAGPMEPVRVQERDGIAVRQAVTPH
jgi:hypothetical protein